MSDAENPNPFDSFIEHQRKALDYAGKAIGALVPPDARENGKQAISESIEGFRVLFNSALDEMQKEVSKMGAAYQNADSAEGPSSTGPHKVKVDVEA